MTGLIDVRGRPLSSEQYAKVSPPKLGPQYAPQWGTDFQRFQLQAMGGLGLVQFDLTKLTLADFRVMRDHYQIGATLAAMSFMLHQMDWKVECPESPRIQKFVQTNVSEIWTQLIRACSQSHWAGFSPCILEWDNDPVSKSVQLKRIKDLLPENTRVNWKYVDGYAPPTHVKPKIPVYDGIKVWGQGWPVPAENTFWYPLMMENGDMYGRKLLKAAFTSWYFSILIHLYSNRYFERFGEPVPVGRAPYDEEIQIQQDGTTKRVNGAELMTSILQSLRNRSVVVLPNQRSTEGGSATNLGVPEFDFDIKYLESQMRGADFERYLGRLDEEMSLAMFTPLLVLRTADVGSYNLGSTHWEMYLNMLNALAGDMKGYIDDFILSRMVDYNFGPSAPRAKIKFRKMGSDKMQLITAIVQALIPTGTVKPNLQELGEIAGLSFEEIQVLTSATGDSGTGAGNGSGPGTGSTGSGKTKKSATKTTSSAAKPAAKPVSKKKASSNSMAIVDQIAHRVAGQISRAVKDPYANEVDLAFGYDRQLANSLASEVDFPETIVSEVYAKAQATLCDVPLSAYSQMQPDAIVTYVREVFSGWLEMNIQ